MERERDSKMPTEKIWGPAPPLVRFGIQSKCMHLSGASVSPIKKIESLEVSVGAATGLHMTRQVVHLTSQQALKPGLLWQLSISLYRAGVGRAGLEPLL